MKLLFKQRLFSWFDSYDVYDEEGNTVFTVKGQLSWGHRLVIFDAWDRELATVQERIFTLMPKFELYQGGCCVGTISREFSLFTPRYDIDFNGWHVEGNFMEWDYTIYAPSGEAVATVSKELWNWTDTYVIDVRDPDDSLCALMLVLAIDAEKCSRN